MMKMVKQVALTFFVFLVLNCIVWTIASLTGVIPYQSSNAIGIGTIIYSIFYLIFIAVYTRKHETLSKLIFLGILILFCVFIGVTGEKATDIVQHSNKLKEGVQFVIGIAIIFLESSVALKQAGKYKEEKRIREEENEKVKVLFEELDANGNITRKGKAKYQ